MKTTASPNPPKTARRCLPWCLATLGALPASLWILKHERVIRRNGRPLHPRELAFGRGIGIETPESVRILAVPRIPSPLGGLLAPLEDRIGFSISQAAGVTLGHGIYLTESCESFELVTHELVHVRQYQDFRSPLFFIWHYFYECLAFGYHDAPLEREAVALSAGRA